MIKGTIWTHSITGREVMLNYIIDRYLMSGHKINSICGNPGMWVTFDNGDRWETERPCDSRRGVACNIALIDVAIDEETVRNIILPTVKCSGVRHYEYFYAKE